MNAFSNVHTESLQRVKEVQPLHKQLMYETQIINRVRKAVIAVAGKAFLKVSNTLSSRLLPSLSLLLSRIFLALLFSASN